MTALALPPVYFSAVEPVVELNTAGQLCRCYVWITDMDVCAGKDVCWSWVEVVVTKLLPSTYMETYFACPSHLYQLFKMRSFIDCSTSFKE